MRQKYRSPEQNVRPGTEYARSIARYRPRSARRSDWTSLFEHPLVPAIAFGLVAAGALMLWPRQAQGGGWQGGGWQGGRLEEHDGDAEYADFPPRRAARGRADAFL